jgi:predicted RNase H-like HicB family nuclease
MKKSDTKPFKEVKIKGHTLALYREQDPEETSYKMHAEVKELSGCYIAGDTEKEILAEAPAVIEVYHEAQQELAGKKQKLVSVKMKPDLFALLSRYAQDQGIESVSTLMRSIVVKKLREEGYKVPSSLSVSR